MNHSPANTLLILGATSEIGVALAKRMAARGFDLQLAARDPAALDALAGNLRTRHRVEVTLLRLEVTDLAGQGRWVDRLPGLPSHVLCLVGKLGDQEQARAGVEARIELVQVNYLGPASLLETLAGRMAKAGGGVIVGASSVAGDRGRRGNYWYGSAKAGFSTFLEGLGHRLWPQVAVITAKPGFVRTRMTAGMNLPPALLCEPERIAAILERSLVRGRPRVLYAPWYWRPVMALLRLLPARLFARIR